MQTPGSPDEEPRNHDKVGNGTNTEGTMIAKAKWEYIPELADRDKLLVLKISVGRDRKIAVMLRVSYKSVVAARKYHGIKTPYIAGVNPELKERMDKITEATEKSIEKQDAHNPTLKKISPYNTFLKKI